MYQLGIDLGTTRSAAAVHRAGRCRTEPPVASVVYDGADGAFAVGEEAQALALTHPSRVIAGFVRRVGDPTPVLLGREPVAPEAIAARFVGRLVAPLIAREGAAPAAIALAHPSGWGRHRVESLRAALSGHPEMVPQAVAAVLGHGRGLEPGALVAVHDLGGTSFDAAVVRIVPGGAELVAPPETIERLGGDDVDEAVFAHIRNVLGPGWAQLDGADPRVQAAVARLRRDCTGAKERLSSDTEVTVPVRLPGLQPTDVRLARTELEDAVHGAVLQTVDALSAALDTAGVAPADLAEVLLVGGSARIPLVAQLVSAGLGRPVTVADEPKGVFAAGAAVWAARRAGGSPGRATVVGAGAAAPGPPAGDAGSAPVALSVAVGAGGPVGTAAGATGALSPAVARPPKQPSAFPTEAAEPSRVPVFVGVGLLALTILGALLLLGASRYSDKTSAVATTPSVVAPAGQQATPSAPRAGTPPPPNRRAGQGGTGQQGAGQGGAAQPPPTTAAPTTTVAPPPPAPPAGQGGDQNGGNGDQNGGSGNPSGGEGGGSDSGQAGNGAGNGAGNDGGDSGGGNVGDAPAEGDAAADAGAQRLAEPSSAPAEAP